MEKELLIEVKNMTKFFGPTQALKRSKPEVLPRRDSWTNRGERKRKSLQLLQLLQECRLPAAVK